MIEHVFVLKLRWWYDANMHLVDRLRELEDLISAEATAVEVNTAHTSIRMLRGFLSAKEAELARRSGGLHATGEGHAPEDVLKNQSKVSQREAARATKRADALGKADAMATGLAEGRLTDEHVDSLADAAGRMNDDARRESLFGRADELAAAASSKSPEQFRRYVNRTANELAGDDGLSSSEKQRKQARLSHGYDAHTGMGWLRVDLHPDDYQSIRRKIDAEVAGLRTSQQFQGLAYDRLAAVAFVNLVVGTRVGRPAPSEVVVLIDYDTLIDGLHPDTVAEYSDGVPLPAETARRHACTADVIPVVLDGEGQPLDVGRGQRQATRAQRHALRAMYRTCAVGGCERSFERCEMHHLRTWEQGGPTDLDNLVPICSFHHHRAHEGRWRLQLEANTRELTVLLPDGSLHSRCIPDLLTDRADRSRNQSAA